MFSFFNFSTFKSNTDKGKVSNSLCGKTLNLNSPEGRALNIFNNKSPIALKQNGNNSLLSNNNKETATSPGFSYRVTQRAQEMNSITPNTDVSNITTSYALDTKVNNIHTIPKDIYDKKRKLMESLDNFGVRKRTRQESGVDAFVYRRQRTINESNTSDRVIMTNGHNHRSTQPISAISSKSVNVENRKIKRQGDFGTSVCHFQKKPRTRNNEILSSYSSSKFLQTGQKRPHPIDYESESPNRKHCKSCTCCGSTMILEDQNSRDYLNKSDKTTETDLSEDLVTFAASRIFNRSGKTQRVKKICMKSILDDVFDDDDPVPYTSIDKVEEKKKKAQKKVNQHTDKSNLKDSNQSVGVDSSTMLSSAISETHPPVTSIISTASTLPVSSATLNSTPTVQSKTPLTLGLLNSSSEDILQTNGVNTTLQINVNSSIAAATDKDRKKTNEIDEKITNNQTHESSKNISVTSTNTALSPNKQNKLLMESPEKNIFVEGSNILGQNDLNSDKDKQQFKYSTLVSKLNEPVKYVSSLQLDGQNSTNKSRKELTPSLVFVNPVKNVKKQSPPVMQFGASKADEKQSTPVMKFGSPKADEKQSTPVMQFGAPKVDEKQSTPVMQFGSPKADEKKSTPVMQFGLPKADEKQSTPVMQFGSPKADEKKSAPVMQFGAPKADEKQSTPVMQFGLPKADEKQSTPVMQFGLPKADEKQSTPVLQFGLPKADEKQSTPVMQFGLPKADEKQSTPVMQFGLPKADEKQSTPVMQFGSPKTDEKQSTPVIQFGTAKESVNSTSTPLFSFSNNQNSSKMTKPSNEPVKFDFLKPHDSTAAASSTQPKSVVFGSNNLPNQNCFNFAKTDNNISLTSDNPPKYNPTPEKPTPKLQFGTLPTPVFGTSNGDQLKPQFSTSVDQSINNQGPKIVFGNPIPENKPTTQAPSMLFANNSNPVFQFNSSSSKSNDKPSEVSNNAFPFSSNKPVTSFGEKQSFQFNSDKKEESKTQFSTPAFGSQSTNVPFKFGDNDKATSFGTTFNSNQPLQFTNNTEKSKEPFKFGVANPTSNAFQFSANKTDNVKFGQASSTFSTPGFSGFGGSTPQQTSTFGSVPSSQPALFSNITSPTAAPTFGSVASPTNTFGTNQSFQFGTTNNAQNSSSTFAFGGNTQPSKPDGAFSFNAAPTSTVSPFQFGQVPLPLSTTQFGGTLPQGSFGFGSPPMSGTGESLFSMGTAPAGERKKAKAVRRRQ